MMLVVVVLVVAAPWPPRCPHPRIKPGAGSSSLPPSGRGDGCCLNWDSWHCRGINGIWCWLLG